MLDEESEEGRRSGKEGMLKEGVKEGRREELLEGGREERRKKGKDRRRKGGRKAGSIQPLFGFCLIIKNKMRSQGN